MKRCAKLAEPPTLTCFRSAQPEATWEEMRDDPHHGGIQAAKDAKLFLVRGQRCLCAYCESLIGVDCSDEGIQLHKSEQRVEHFHPKSDTSRPPNWNLHWPNLWAVCLGGSKQSESAQEPALYPLPQNLSCDAFKDYQIKTGKLAFNPEGWIRAPDQIPAFPPLFQFSPDGVPEPHNENCAATTFLDNKYLDSQELVAKTIEHMNLGCFRLSEKRRIAKARLEKDIKKARQLAQGTGPDEVMLGLSRRLLASNPTSPWPEHFSLVRWRLGASAEEHLSAIGYDG